MISLKRATFLAAFFLIFGILIGVKADRACHVNWTYSASGELEPHEPPALCALWPWG